MTDIITMGEIWFTESEHKGCTNCHMCIECGDCESYGCGEERQERSDLSKD